MILLNDLPTFDSYFGELFKRLNRAHARDLKPLVHMLIGTMFPRRLGPVMARTYKGNPGNVVWWTSRMTRRQYTIVHRSGHILILHKRHVIYDFTAASPLDHVSIAAAIL